MVEPWLADTDESDPSNAPSLIVFTPDGIHLESASDDIDGCGACRSTGGHISESILLVNNSDEQENLAASTKVRVTVEVAANGQSFTAS